MGQEKIGKFIAQCRKELNMTQEQLAEKLGISNKTVSRWENGNTFPDISILQDLCGALNISVNELLAGERIPEDNFRKKVEENTLRILEDYGPSKFSFGGIDVNLGFFGSLTILFIILKLVNVIKWSWIWVLAPLWLGLGLCLIFLVVVLIVMKSKIFKRYNIKKPRIKIEFK